MHDDVLALVNPSVSPELNAISGDVVDAAVKIHKALGPGLLERPYRLCLAHELRKRRHEIAEEVPISIEYEGLRIDQSYRIDLLVDGQVVVEVKAVERLLDVHEAQLLSYLRFGQHRLGLLLNFRAARMKEGIQRLVL